MAPGLILLISLFLLPLGELQANVKKFPLEFSTFPLALSLVSCQKPLQMSSSLLLVLFNSVISPPPPLKRTQGSKVDSWYTWAWPPQHYPPYPRQLRILPSQNTDPPGNVHHNVSHSADCRVFPFLGGFQRHYLLTHQSGGPGGLPLFSLFP